MNVVAQVVLVYFFVISTALQTLLLLITRNVLIFTASGPYAWIYGLLPLYFFDVPALSRFRICGILCNEKCLVYGMCLQVWFFWCNFGPDCLR